MIEELIPLDNALSEEDLPPGTKLLGGQFTIIGSLGAGGFSNTYRATDNVLGRTVVIKECFPDYCCCRDGKRVVPRGKPHVEQLRSIVDMFMREARSLAKLRHPNIVAVHSAFEENDTAYMVLDLIDGPDLLQILEQESASLSPARVKDILLQMLDAIEKVHALDLLHRDISPDNIILESTGLPVLIDFGAARSDASKKTRAISALLVVKDGYSPQEFYVAGSIQTPSSDLYALAATFFHLLSGRPAPNSQARLLALSSNQPDPLEPLEGRIDGYDPVFLRAIDTAMRIQPSDRLQSAAQWRSIIARAKVSEGDMAAPSLKPTPQRISLDLERSLTRLVAETNDEVRKTNEVMPDHPVTPKPVKAKAREIPDWVKEFNNETRIKSEDLLAIDDRVNAELEDQTGNAMPAARSPIQPAPLSETNWVRRAIEKQDRQREQDTAVMVDSMDPDPAPVISHPVSAPLPTDNVLTEIYQPAPRKSGLLVPTLIGAAICLVFSATLLALLPPSAPADAATLQIWQD